MRIWYQAECEINLIIFSPQWIDLAGPDHKCLPHTVISLYHVVDGHVINHVINFISYLIGLYAFWVQLTI